MAEVKNSFLSSKMNKDLDDRLIPNNEYREALNISIGKSEGDSMGVAQTVLGNVQLKDSNGIPFETVAGLICIGSFSDNKNNRIYQFLTDYTDPSPSLITLPDITKTMKITVYDPSLSPNYYTLVSGTFLNFSKTNLITGINLVEDLLFFTDDRNQPRKINVTSALNNPGYYYNEAQISVAKYAPIEPISLIRKVTADIVSGSGTTYLLTNIVGPIAEVMKPGAAVLVNNTSGSKIVNGSEYIFVKSFSGSTVILYTQPTNPISAGYKITFLNSTMTDKADVVDWPGDPSFIEGKFIRFSYRFKFDDNEYSLLAPFTQIAYIPKQKGYFIDGNESDAYRSTVVKWFENNSNNIELLIPFPDKCNLVTDSYKITEVDILYKESDSNISLVIDSIPASGFGSINNSNIYTYNYQSQKPYKTLSPSQITRVYDNVPVRALAQESAGNRIIYGNFHTTYAAPRDIDYNTSVIPKQDIFDSFIEYPNHTLKQNRNYQVGFILSDKFGRSSSVILSSVDAQIASGGTAALSIGGSTVYAPYESKGQANFPDVKEWFGNALTLLVNKEISSNRDIPNGTPGLYAIPAATNGFSIIANATINVLDTPTNTYKYTFTLDTTVGVLNTVPVTGQYLRGKYTDYVKIIDVQAFPFTTPPTPPTTLPIPPSGQYRITTDKEINNLYLFDSTLGTAKNTKYAYTINDIGWYSYKVVVKQQQQDYYNVYLPGMLQGYPEGQTYGTQVVYTGASITPPITASTISYNGINTTSFPVGEEGKTSHIVLINDNINKVPRDLTEVGPDQKQYRSSVVLFGKVENKAAKAYIISDATVNDFEAYQLTYTIALQPDNSYLNIKIGDGIQNDGANAPVGGLANPDRWYADTVVTSHVISGATGTIKWSPKNVLRDSTSYSAYANFTITRAENTQYFPTRKGDVVSSIATARDFNFLENDVNNIKGTSSINFYQNQTNPLIGRIATFNTIGVPALDMIPFLSVYETTPETSALALFWETATTGYISDLNWDVLTGFDGPSRISTFNFRFYEDQNFNGIDPDEGDAESKYITSSWQILNATGLPLTPSNIQITNISPDLSINLPKFGIETTGGNTHRLYIKDYFVFDSNANINSNFTFEITVTYGGATYPLYITGRLRNRPPTFKLPENDYNRTISKITGPIVTVTAENGSRGPALEGNSLSWDILSGNNSNYFSIGTTTGLVSLVNASIPVGAYTLQIRVRDAMSINPPTELTNSDPELATQSATISIVITVGSVAINPGLAFFNTTSINEPNVRSFVWNVADPIISNGTEITCAPVNGQGVGAIYIGTQDITLDANGQSPDLPFWDDPTYFGEIKYQNFVNVEVANGKTFGSVDPPLGLVQGEMQFEVSNFIEANRGQNRTNNCGVFLYYREDPSYPWVIAKDSNGIASLGNPYPNAGVTGEAGLRILAGQTPTAQSTVDFNITALNPKNTYGVWGGGNGEKTTKIVVNTPGEYCLVINNYEYINTEDTLDPLYPEAIAPDTFNCNNGNQAGINVIVRDANYDYGGLPDNPGDPLPSTAQKYFVAGREYSLSAVIPGYPTGTPLDTQNAVSGFASAIPTTPASSNVINGNRLNLDIANAQLVKGMYYKGTSWNSGIATASSSTVGLVTTVTITGGTTANIVVGMVMTINAGSPGSGSLYANTIVTSVDNSTQFKISVAPFGGNLVGRTFTVNNQWLTTGNYVITDFENSRKTLVLSTSPTLAVNPLPAFAKIAFGFNGAGDGALTDSFGVVYSPSINPINVKQFFTDEQLSIPWYPPVAAPVTGTVYNFTKDQDFTTYLDSTDVSGTGFIDYTHYPYFSAFFDAQGKVIPQTGSTANTVVTGWGKYVGTTQYPFNRGRNIYQTLDIFRN